jgi:hypothetical protein
MEHAPVWVAAQDLDEVRAREESFRAPERIVGRVTRWA